MGNEKKANGTYRARVNARGYEQVKGIHYDESSTAAPVTNDTTIRIIYVLAILAGWSPYVIDVQGAFLNGRFGENEHLYLEIPDGFENFYDKTKVLKLNRTIYGLKQSAQAFWSELLKAFKTMEFKRSDGDPCCYFKKVDNRLVVCLSWVDDCLFLGRRDDVIMAADEMKLYFECDDIGFTDTYVGCKITMNKEMKTVRFEQPVMIKSLVDEFGISGKTMKIPATHGTVLQPGEVKDELKGKEKKRYQAGVGKLLYLARWSRPDINNIVRELTRFTTRPQIAHMESMIKVMHYCVSTNRLGLTLNPKGKWDGKFDDTEFVIGGYSDSDYAKDGESRRSVTGYCVFLNEAPVAMKSRMQDAVTLSVTEAELVAATQCIQEMMYVKKLIESVGLKVQLPMVLYVDNKGVKDLINGWSVGGRTRHIDVRYFFLRELKEKGIAKVEWVRSNNNPSDLFTKNLNIELFEVHAKKFVQEM
jgi:hypothetical protein